MFLPEMFRADHSPVFWPVGDRLIVALVHSDRKSFSIRHGRQTERKGASLLPAVISKFAAGCLFFIEKHSVKIVRFLACTRVFSFVEALGICSVMVVSPQSCSRPEGGSIVAGWRGGKRIRGVAFSSPRGGGGGGGGTRRCFFGWAATACFPTK